MKSEKLVRNVPRVPDTKLHNRFWYGEKAIFSLQLSIMPYHVWYPEDKLHAFLKFQITKVVDGQLDGLRALLTGFSWHEEPVFWWGKMCGKAATWSCKANHNIKIDLKANVHWTEADNDRVQCCRVQHSTVVLQSTAQYSGAAEYSTAQWCCRVQHSRVVLQSTAQYSGAAEYSTVQWCCSGRDIECYCHIDKTLNLQKWKSGIFKSAICQRQPYSVIEQDTSQLSKCMAQSDIMRNMDAICTLKYSFNLLPPPIKHLKNCAMILTASTKRGRDGICGDTIPLYTW